MHTPAAQPEPRWIPANEAGRKEKGRRGGQRIGQYGYLHGGAEGSRTPGLLNAIQALSQLSYSPFSLKKENFV
jgi:hypothetical protein